MEEKESRRTPAVQVLGPGLGTRADGTSDDSFSPKWGLLEIHSKLDETDSMAVLHGPCELCKVNGRSYQRHDEFERSPS